MFNCKILSVLPTPAFYALYSYPFLAFSKRVLLMYLIHRAGKNLDTVFYQILITAESLFLENKMSQTVKTRRETCAFANNHDDECKFSLF